MIVYRVALHVPKPLLAEWSQWMVHEHIPDVLETGCFLSARLAAALPSNDNPAEMLVEVEYTAGNESNYQRYMEIFSDSLRKKHTEKYGDSITATRTVLIVEAMFSSDESKGLDDDI